MRFLITASLIVCACGNWSNEDIEYLYALPQKDALKAKFGDMASTGQGVRRDPLLGDDAGTYLATKAGSDKFNEFLDNVLTGLDTLRTIPPTKREENKRIWGPYADEKNAGFDVKAEIVKTAERRYSWSFQARKRGSEEFVTLGGGTFVATETLRKGQGTFFFDAVAAVMLYGKPKDMPTDPDRISVGYKTDSDPVIVEVDVTVPGIATPVSWDSNRYSDNSAVLTYIVSDLPDPDARSISAVAAWDTKTAGDVTYTVLAGNNRGAVARQCWDENQKVVHEYVMLPDGGVYMNGPASNCAKVPTLQALPPLP